jgi:hypothetical protein
MMHNSISPHMMTPFRTEVQLNLNEALEYHNRQRERLSRYLRSSEGNYFEIRMERDKHERFATAIAAALVLITPRIVPPPDETPSIP